MAWFTRPERAIRLSSVLLALTTALYLVQLDRYPAVIGGDEVQFAVHAESLARSGRDLNGVLMPGFIRITDPLVPNDSSHIWYQPFLFYLMTPFIAAFGVSEWAARLPVALIAIANVGLIYLIAKRLFGDTRIAIATALMLATSPAHVIVARQALDYIAPLPFVLAWLLCLLRFLDTRSTAALAFGLFMLGAGAVSYVAAWMLMPLFFLLTIAVVWQSAPKHRTRIVMIATVAFVLGMAGLAVAWLRTPEALTQILTRYDVGAAARPRAGLWQRVSVYWDYFNPSFLFFAGGSNPTQATGRAGVFLLALAPLLVAGLRQIYRHGSTRAYLVAAAFVLSPLPIVVTMPPDAGYSIARAMTLLPFAALLAGYGLQWLSSRAPRWALVAVSAGFAVQFALFAHDYLGDYQARVHARLDPVNMGAVADALAANATVDAPPAIYFSHVLDDGGVRWRFFALKNHRLDLWDRSREIDVTGSSLSIAPGALIVCYANEPAATALKDRGYRVVATVPGGENGVAAAIILRAPG